MGFRRYRLGLEWTDSFFKLVEVHQSRGKDPRDRCGGASASAGMVPERREMVEPESVVQAVREALKGKKLHTRKVHIAISGGHVRVMRRRLPELGRTEASKMGSKKDSPRGGPAVGGSGV